MGLLKAERGAKGKFNQEGLGAKGLRAERVY